MPHLGGEEIVLVPLGVTRDLPTKAGHLRMREKGRSFDHGQVSSASTGRSNSARLAFNWWKPAGIQSTRYAGKYIYALR